MNIDQPEVTVAHVAEAAGVSKATASRVLGGYGAVSSASRARVTAAANRLGYRPNELARTLSTRRSSTLGMIISDIQNPYFARVTRGVADGVAEAGYDILLSNSDEDLGNERRAIDVQLRKRVDGILIAPAPFAGPEQYDAIRKAHRPLVLFDRSVPGLGLDTVLSDNYDGARRLTRLLLDAGHRRVTFMTPTSPVSADGDETLLSLSSIADRAHGFIDELAEAGVPSPDLRMRTGLEEWDVIRLLPELVSGPDGTTAFIASDSVIAAQLYAAARAVGLRIPDDFSLVAFDDADWTQLVDPAVTVMSQPAYDIGHLASRLLLEQLEAERPARREVLSQTLLERGSVAPPR